MTGGKVNIKNLRRYLTEKFENSGIESPDTESGLLVMHYFKIDKTQLLISSREITDSELEEIEVLANRRINGEPIRYIIGEAPFMDMTFFVNPSTLIPRADTEILVEKVIECANGDLPVIWDIGCGSGCVGLSLAYHIPNSKVIEIDISKAALETANKTAKRYNLTDRVTFFQWDILSGMPPLPVPDIIVSNPPYIPRKDIDGLMREVKDFEPLSALDGGKDGLVFYREIIKSAPLKKDGLLAFEIGYDQGETVPDLMRDFGYRDVELIYDLSKNPRVVLGYK